MKRSEEEKAVKELSIAVSKLLECYQFDHLPIKHEKTLKELRNIQKKLKEVECFLMKEE